MVPREAVDCNDQLAKVDQLKARFIDFFGKKGFHFEQAETAIPPDSDSTGRDFLACNAMAFSGFYSGEESGAGMRLARIQPSVRPGSGSKIGFSAKHMTSFDMMGLFDFDTTDPGEIFAQVIDYFVLEVGLLADEIVINVSDAPDNVFGEVVRERQDVSVNYMGAEQLVWQELDGLSGFRAEINWRRPDGTVWELWNVSYVDGRIFDSGGSLERILAAKEKADSVFDVGELALIKSKLDALVATEYTELVYFLCDQIRTFERLTQYGVQPAGSKGGRAKFARHIAENIIATAYSLGIDCAALNANFNFDLSDEDTGFNRKIDQAKAFARRHWSPDEVVSLSEILSGDFYSNNIARLNLLKLPHVLVAILLDMGFTVGLPPQEELSAFLNHYPKVVNVMLERNRPNAVISQLRLAIGNIDPEAAIALVGSSSEIESRAIGDIDLVVVSNQVNIFDLLKNSIPGFEALSDDSLRFDYEGYEVGIVPLSTEQFDDRVLPVLSGEGLEPRYKPWAVGGEVPEGFLGDMLKARIIKTDRRGIVRNIQGRIEGEREVLFMNIVNFTLKELQQRLEQVSRQIEIGSKGRVGLDVAKAQAKFVLIRLAYAMNQVFFRGVKRVDNDVVESDEDIKGLVDLLESDCFQLAIAQKFLENIKNKL